MSTRSDSSFRAAGATLLLAFLASAPAEAYYTVSQVVTNFSTTTMYGIHAEHACASPPLSVASHFDGPTSGPLAGHFSNFSIHTGWPGEYLRWWTFNDYGVFGLSNAIDPFQSIRIGWTLNNSSAPPHCQGTWMRFEDENGEGYHCAAGAVSPGSSWEDDRLHVAFVNPFDYRLLIRELCYFPTPDSVSLPDLGPENEGLNHQLDLNVLSNLLELEPGDSVDVVIPEDLQPGGNLVLRFRPDDGGSCTAVTSYVEFDLPPPPTPVRQSTWGAIKSRFRP